MADSFKRNLSDAQVRNAKPGEKPVKLTDGGGLYLLVQPNGGKHWRYKFTVNAKEGVFAIGTYPEIPLSTARDAHRDARALVAAGINPVQSRKDQREEAAREARLKDAGAFETVLASWRAVTDGPLAARSQAQRSREMRKHVGKAFAGRSIKTITRPEIVKLLRDIEEKTPEVARNVRSYLSAIFEHAIDTGLTVANPVPPVRTLRPREQVQFAAMEIEKLPLFLTAVRDSEITSLTVLTAMLMVMLTACRKTEVTAARWSEFDLDAKDWIIPPERMKARREHWVPLSDQAVALLRHLRSWSVGEYVFPHRYKPNTPMAANSINALMDRLKFTAETVHGFRSMFSTHFNALGENPDVIERCLAHAPANRVRAAYNRHQYKDERRVMLQTWADHLNALAPGALTPREVKPVAEAA